MSKNLAQVAESENLISERLLKLLGGDLKKLQKLEHEDVVNLIKVAVQESNLSEKTKKIHATSPHGVIGRAVKTDNVHDAHFFVANMILSNQGHKVIKSR